MWKLQISDNLLLQLKAAVIMSGPPDVLGFTNLTRVLIRSSYNSCSFSLFFLGIVNSAVNYQDTNFPQKTEENNRQLHFHKFQGVKEK